MYALSGEATLSLPFLPPFSMGLTVIGKNFSPRIKFFPSKSSHHLRRAVSFRKADEVIKVAPFVKMTEKCQKDQPICSRTLNILPKVYGYTNYFSAFLSQGDNFCDFLFTSWIKNL